MNPSLCWILEMAQEETQVNGGRGLNKGGIARYPNYPDMVGVQFTRRDSPFLTK